jgi:signal transduction histidine kinase
VPRAERGGTEPAGSNFAFSVQPPSVMSSILEAVLKFFDGPHAGGDPEQFRRARLLTGFGILGALFGTAYSAFYLSVGHYWGALVIILCSACFALMPWLLRWGWGQPVLAEAYSIILVIGFFALCWLEDGLHGHAIAWLASVPLCALLLIGLKGATRWGVVCTSAAGVIAGLEFIGQSAPITYPAHLENLISTVGYLGLIVFMLLLGVIFERGREQAAKKMLAANDELSRANARLVRLNQEKNEFLSIAAHDLKNPLTVVRGMSDLLAMGILPPEKLKSTAEKISSQAVRMHDLIANLLDLNAIEEGRTNLRLEPLDLGSLTRQVCENFAGVAGQKQIRLNHANEPATAPAVGDRAATLQVLDNLVSNALKYSPKGSEVVVRVVPLADQVTVEVVDRGPGISAEDQAKLFQRFTKLTARPTAGESSNGLGLSIVKRLVEAMNGRISCRSQLGQGTTFVFALPREAARERNATQAQANQAASINAAEVLVRPAEWRLAASGN